MAKRGAPFGNNNGGKHKIWLLALERHVAKRPKDLEEIAKKVFDAAKAGEAWAVQEIGNRLDGKPVQPVDVKDERQSKSLSTEYLKFVASGGRPDEWQGETIQ